jgi:hypothetical protein
MKINYQLLRGVGKLYIQEDKLLKMTHLEIKKRLVVNQPLE